MSTASESKKDEHDNNAGGVVHVQVQTTSGAYPSHGDVDVRARDAIHGVLKQAAKVLGLPDTASWVATIGGTVIDVSKSFSDLKLHGHVRIDWGPAHGGGGC